MHGDMLMRYIFYRRNTVNIKRLFRFLDRFVLCGADRVGLIDLPS